MTLFSLKSFSFLVSIDPVLLIKERSVFAQVECMFKGAFTVPSLRSLLTKLGSNKQNVYLFILKSLMQCSPFQVASNKIYLLSLTSLSKISLKNPVHSF